jgi:hypothetical protein
MSVRRSCRLMLLRRASCYYKSQARDSSAVRQRMRELAMLRPRFGYERIQFCCAGKVGGTAATGSTGYISWKDSKFE